MFHGWDHVGSSLVAIVVRLRHEFNGGRRESESTVRFDVLWMSGLSLVVVDCKSWSWTMVKKTTDLSGSLLRMTGCDLSDLCVFSFVAFG